jgi:hypothetical protein
VEKVMKKFQNMKKLHVFAQISLALPRHDGPNGLAVVELVTFGNLGWLWMAKAFGPCFPPCEYMHISCATKGLWHSKVSISLQSRNHFASLNCVLEVHFTLVCLARHIIR